MSAPEVVIDAPNGEEDVEMVGDGAEVDSTGESGIGGGLENIEPVVPERTGFIDYLKSPIIEISVGADDAQTTLYAHQALLTQSPYLADLIANSDASSSPRRISLSTEDVPATASTLEYLYKNDYFPALSSSSSLDHDPSIPRPDTTGIGLLRHARIYTLAKKLSLPTLATLAHRKIHLVDSTARGEIAYARYVYGHTTEEEKEIRKPVAQFWATRSHVLRHEAEAEFKGMCLQFPQFGFDVLSMVLDAQERRSGKESLGSGGVGRKRARVSQG